MNLPIDIHCDVDGDQVCALIGPNLMEGVAGFGPTLADALRDLAEQLVAEAQPADGPDEDNPVKHAYKPIEQKEKSAL